jgi:hypothetical protein
VIVVTGDQDSKVLKNQLRSIETKLDPFLELAKARFPGLDSTAALQRLSGEIKELEDKTKTLEKTATEEKTARQALATQFEKKPPKTSNKYPTFKKQLKSKGNNRQFIPGMPRWQHGLMVVIKALEVVWPSATRFPGGGRLTSRGKIISSAKLSARDNSIRCSKSLITPTVFVFLYLLQVEHNC